jgi:hypothetical protein
MAKRKPKNKAENLADSSLLIDPGYDDLQLIKLDDIDLLIENNDADLLIRELSDSTDALLNDPWLAQLEAETNKIRLISETHAKCNLAIYQC